MIEKKGKKLNLKNIPVSVEDTNPQSTYFVITEFSDILTSGKNAIALNGSNLLKANSSIQIEVLDVKGDPLYTEIARTSDTIRYRDGVSLIVAIYVYGSTPLGTGEIIILGELKSGGTVRWKRNVNINSKIANSTKVRFYETPELHTKPILSDIFGSTSNFPTSSVGSVYSLAVSPAVGTNFLLYDINRKEVDYRILRTTGGSFSSFMEGSDIIFSNINGTTESFSTKVEQVISENSMRVSSPYIVTQNASTKIVSTFSSANYSITYVPLLLGNLVKPVVTGSEDAKYFKQSLAEITLQNLKTFSGNVYRFRLYRKSLNTNFDSECIADELLESREVIVDEANPNRLGENIGYFFNPDHIARYWFPSTITISGSFSNDPLADGMFISESIIQSSSIIQDRHFVLAKDFTTGSNRDSVYVPFDSAEDIIGSGSAHDSNFIKLFKNVEYVFSANVVGFNTNPQNQGGLSFYLTGSQYSFSTSNLFDGYGIKLLDVILPKNVAEKHYGRIETSFIVNQDVNGTMVIAPYNGNFIISKVSIKPSQAFSFSPEILNIRVPFAVDVKNARYQIRAELFDVNSNQIPVKLETTEFFDPDGITLAKISSSLFSNIVNSPPGFADFDFINPTVETIHVLSSSQIDGNLTVFGNAFLTASQAISSSYAKTSSLSIAINAVSASYSLSSSYAVTSSNLDVDSSFSSSIDRLFQIGTFYFWVSGSGASAVLRLKDGSAPTTENDGKPVA